MLPDSSRKAHELPYDTMEIHKVFPKIVRCKPLTCPRKRV